MKKVDEAYFVRLWGGSEKEMHGKINVDSISAFGEVVRKVCPEVAKVVSEI